MTDPTDPTGRGNPAPTELAKGVLEGQRRAVARAISLIEDGGSEAQLLLATLYPHTGRAHIIGVTGPPGSGKSTLVNALALHFRKGNVDRPSATVGIIAVDPTSPFSGGAILGDRIRMRDLAGDRGIFIRSMASRGNLGGLAWATADAVKVLDAAGYDLIIVETVGAGQAEVEIARTAHTTLVVEVPGLGDDIQAIKAGILEIANVFAVNKADLEGADHAVMALRMMLDLDADTASEAVTFDDDILRRSRTIMHHGRLMDLVSAAQEPGGEPAGVSSWRPPIHKTVAPRREGIAELAETILSHRLYLAQTGGLEWCERERAAAQLEMIIQQEALRDTLERSDADHLAALVDQIARREVDPYTVGRRLLSALCSL